jgi:outer membrane protein OmpA-like peptidoglycan-associated protein
MIRCRQITVALAVAGILFAFVFPWTLGAQEEKFMDCRERSCDVEDIVKALQPPPTGATRGLPTTAMPMAAMPTTAIPMAAIAVNVYFGTNSDRIAPKYYADLNKLGEALTQLQASVEIAGYTDNVGSDQANQLLSQRRAISVKQYLEQHFSFPTERLIAKGYGKSRPRARNDTESGRRQNRRIEVALLKP